MNGKLKIRKVGTSAGVILPKDLLEQLDLKVGDELTVTTKQNSLELSPYDEDFSRRVRAFERSRRKFRNAYRELAK
ncbi:MAG: AbrB/MazE/SpoVT family DNA-binding domain-containing protein [Gammaproteobacteria bacterium]|nr:AbrB/MazE/SpoVT family DNA-binding domain-containing protein [Gammaproteobacteria bacterium]